MQISRKRERCGGMRKERIENRMSGPGSGLEAFDQPGSTDLQSIHSYRYHNHHKFSLCEKNAIALKFNLSLNGFSKLVLRFTTISRIL